LQNKRSEIQDRFNEFLIENKIDIGEKFAVYRYKLKIAENDQLIIKCDLYANKLVSEKILLF